MIDWTKPLRTKRGEVVVKVSPNPLMSKKMYPMLATFEGGGFRTYDPTGLLYVGEATDDDLENFEPDAVSAIDWTKPLRRKHDKVRVVSLAPTSNERLRHQYPWEVGFEGKAETQFYSQAGQFYISSAGLEDLENFEPDVVTPKTGTSFADIVRRGFESAVQALGPISLNGPQSVKVKLYDGIGAGHNIDVSYLEVESGGSITLRGRVVNEGGTVTGRAAPKPPIDITVPLKRRCDESPAVAIYAPSDLDGLLTVRYHSRGYDKAKRVARNGGEDHDGLIPDSRTAHLIVIEYELGGVSVYDADRTGRTVSPDLRKVKSIKHRFFAHGVLAREHTTV